MLFEESWFCDKDFFEAAWQQYVTASEGLPGAQAMFEVGVPLLLSVNVQRAQMQHPDKTASFPADFTAYHAGGRTPHYYVLLICQYDGVAYDDQAKAYIAKMSKHLREDHVRVTGRDHALCGVTVEDHEPVEQIYGPHL
ncbi:MAG: hypothetical protein INR71_13975, partial [Terriglobus roseus]|nr:hypothetical protein [Terriglobus roseus]